MIYMKAAFPADDLYVVRDIEGRSNCRARAMMSVRVESSGFTCRQPLGQEVKWTKEPQKLENFAGPACQPRKS